MHLVGVSGTRGKRWLFRLVAVLFIFGLVEVVWRVYVFKLAGPRRYTKWARPGDIPEEKQRYLRHPYLGYSLNPNYRKRDEDGKLISRHNGMGFRGSPFPAQKPEGTYRIALLGGSSTYDTKIPEDELTFAAQLDRLLGENVHVINAGVGGYTSWESLINLQLRVLEADPDLVIVYHGINDVRARLIPPERYVRDGTGYRIAWTDEFHWWDHSLVLHCFGIQLGMSQRNDVYSHTLLETPEDLNRDHALEANRPTFFRKNLGLMVAVARHSGAKTMISSWAHSPHKEDSASRPVFQKGFLEGNGVCREVAKKTGAAFFDFAAQMPGNPELWSDGRHSNAAGAKKKAELFAAFIREVILKR